MATQKQIEANRQNALLSTGPKTPEGKAKVSLNAVKHGIFTRELVITMGDGREDEAEYHRLFAELIADLAPQGRMEMLLVERVAVNYWRLKRLIRYETGEIRIMLDNFMRETIERYLEDCSLKHPAMKYYRYDDEIPEDEYQTQVARVEALRSPDFDLASDEVALEWVFYGYVQEDDEGPTEADWERTKEYINSLSPQQRNEIRKELLEEEEKILAEMKEVRRWKERFDRVSRVRTIPIERRLNKIIKYESSLERSIFRNLAVLKTLQEKRQSMHDSIQTGEPADDGSYTRAEGK